MNSTITSEQLIAIAQEFGTPVYIYHAEKIKEQYKKLKTGFQHTNTRFFYACKALSNINVLKYINELGAGLDCVSIHEVQLGLKTGFDPKNILFTPNCVDFEEIEMAKKLGVNINIDNISILEQFGNKYGSSYPVCIRLNPHIMAGGNYKISTGHIDSKFGISIHQIRHIERIVKTTGMHIKGLHMHTGSEIKDIDVFLKGVEILFESAKQFPELEFIDLGSGFKVPYHPDDNETDINLLGKKVGEVFAARETIEWMRDNTEYTK
jgi:diaminopimelate decarboxylase